jgi:hypothetical protein
MRPCATRLRRSSIARPIAVESSSSHAFKKPQLIKSLNLIVPDLDPHDSHPGPLPLTVAPSAPRGVLIGGEAIFGSRAHCF